MIGWSNMQRKKVGRSSRQVAGVVITCITVFDLCAGIYHAEKHAV